MNLISKLGTAAVVSLLGALPAQAFTNLGFETGNTSGWINGPTTLPSTFDAMSSFSFPVGLVSHVIAPVEGNYFGLLTTEAMGSSFALNFGAATTGAEKLWLRFLSNDVVPYSDFAVVNYSGPGGAGVLANLSVPGNSPDSSWIAYCIPIGTTLLTFSLNDVGDQRSHPYLAIDASMVPVPEPAASTLALAGFAVMAFLARRRRAA